MYARDVADNPTELVSGLVHLEGQADLVSRFIQGITRITIWTIRVIDLLT